MRRIEPSHDEFDAVKGVLIVCIVLGHVSIANTLIPTLKTIVYSFHVYCFLLFPFLFPAKPFTANCIKDIIVRYMVPYVIVVVLCSILYSFVMPSNLNIFLWLWNLLRALITGNDLYLKIGCGFGLYWFMPVILLLNILKSFYYSRKPLARQIFIAVLCLGHLFLGAIPWQYKQYFPFLGIHIAAFVLPIGLLCGYVFRKYSLILIKMKWLILCLFTLTVATMFRVGSSVNLSHLGVPSYKNPLLLLLHDLIPIFAFFTLLSFSNVLAKVPFIALIGNCSLLIYLTHQIFVFVVEVSLGKSGLLSSSVVFEYMTGMISLSCGVCFPVAISYFLSFKPNLKRLIVPRNRNEFFFGFTNCLKR